MLVVPSKGRLIIQGYDGTLREYEADRLDQFTDQLLGREVSDAVVTDQSLTFARDVWQKYTMQDHVPPNESNNGEGREPPR